MLFGRKAEKMEKVHKVELLAGTTAVGLENSLRVQADDGRWAFVNDEGLFYKVQGALSCEDGEHWLLHPFPIAEHGMRMMEVYFMMMSVGFWQFSHDTPPEIEGYSAVGRVEASASFCTDNAILVLNREFVACGVNASNQWRIDLLQVLNSEQLHQLAENVQDLLSLCGVKFKLLEDDIENEMKFLLNETPGDGKITAW